MLSDDIIPWATPEQRREERKCDGATFDPNDSQETSLRMPASEVINMTARSSSFDGDDERPSATEKRQVGEKESGGRADAVTDAGTGEMGRLPSQLGSQLLRQAFQSSTFSKLDRYVPVWHMALDEPGLNSKDSYHLMFHMLDLNGNGQVTVDEVVVVLEGLLGSHRHDFHQQMLASITATESKFAEPGGGIPEDRFARFMAEFVDNHAFYCGLACVQPITSVMMVKQFIKAPIATSSTQLRFCFKNFLKVLLWCALFPLSLTWSLWMHRQQSLNLLQLLVVSKIHAWAGQRWGALLCWRLWFPILAAAIWHVTTYACVLLYWCTYGVKTVKEAIQEKSFSYFSKYQHVETQVSFFQSHVSMYLTVFVYFAVAAKLSVRDTNKVRQLAMLVRDLSQDELRIDSSVEAFQEFTFDKLLAEIESRVDKESGRSRVLKVSRLVAIFGAPAFFCVAMPILRLVFVGNMWSSDRSGLAATFCQSISVVVPTLFFATESYELGVILYEQRMRTVFYSALFSREEARVNRLPCLNNRSPRNIQIWAHLRTYLQSQRVLDLRWAEAAVGLLCISALAVTVIVVVATFQGTIVEDSSDIRVVLCYSLLGFMGLFAVVIALIPLAVSIGEIYTQDLYRLNKESWEIECMLQIEGKVMAEVDRSILAACKSLLEKLISLLDKSNEYLEIFGVPVDTRLKNAMLSFVLTGIVAAVSAFVSLLVRYNLGGN